MRVYVAGPYTKGDVVINVRNAIQAAETLAMWGHTPFIPHLSHPWHTVAPHPWGFWMEQDIAWLRVCEAVLRIPGESTGADKETAEAERLSIPVYHSLGAFREGTRGKAKCSICDDTGVMSTGSELDRCRFCSAGAA